MNELEQLKKEAEERRGRMHVQRGHVPHVWKGPPDAEGDCHQAEAALDRAIAIAARYKMFIDEFWKQEELNWIHERDEARALADQVAEALDVHRHGDPFLAGSTEEALDAYDKRSWKS